jgi:hypothetical protein
MNWRHSAETCALASFDRHALREPTVRRTKTEKNIQSIFVIAHLFGFDGFAFRLFLLAFTAMDYALALALRTWFDVVNIWVSMHLMFVYISVAKAFIADHITTHAQEQRGQRTPQLVFL